MRILIFGAGAIGSFVGGLLTKKNDVILVGREAHMQAIIRHGLKITGLTRMIAHPMCLTDIKELDTLPELVILTVKSYDTSNAIKILAPMLRSGIPLLSLQNGLNNVEKILSIRVVGKKGCVLAASTSHGVTYLGPGSIRHSGAGELVLGELDGTVTSRLKRYLELFDAVGLSPRITTNIYGELWLKAIVNACINPLTAIIRQPNGYLLESPELKKLMKLVCKECIRVARAVNVPMPKVAIFEKIEAVLKATAKNKSSMLQDIERGKRTEIEDINGAIVAVGKKAGVPTPYNSMLVALVKALEQSVIQAAGYSSCI